MLENTDLTPIIKNKTKKRIQARIPKIPVVAVKVVNSPEPESKEVFQNWVLFTTAGLYIDQASANLFGPRPKTGCLKVTPLVMDIVAEREGPTSVFDNCNLLGIKFPTKDPEIKNNIAIIMTIKEVNGKCFLSCSPSSFLCSVIET